MTTTSASINNSSDPVTFSVTSVSAFPTSGDFTVLIGSEILLVTSVSGNNFTASRAQEGTTIASHSSGATIALILTAASLTRLIRQSGWRPYPLFTVTAPSDEFDDGTFSGWTSVGSTPTPTVSEGNDQLSIIHPGGGSASQFYAWMKSASISAGDKIEIAFRSVIVNENYPIIGVFFADGATYNSGNQVVFYFSPTENAVWLNRMSGYNSTLSTNNIGFSPGTMGSHIFMRLTMTATNTWKAECSCDGRQWITFFSGVSLSLTPTHVGFGVTKWGGTQQAMWALEYFRKG